MRYEIVVRNLSNSPLTFHCLGGAIETAPPPVTPNIPAGGTVVLQVRVKQNAINPTAPGAPAGTGEIYYTRQDGNSLRFYKFIVMRAVTLVAVQRRLASAGSDPRTLPANSFTAWQASQVLSELKKIANQAVHLGTTRLRVSV